MVGSRCAHFLGVPVPANAFPKTNERAEFWAKFGGEPETKATAPVAARA